MFNQVSWYGSIFIFMEKIELEAKRLVGEERKKERNTLLHSQSVTSTESKRRYLEGGGKKHHHFTLCVKCGHKFVDLLPSNDTLHTKCMSQLKRYLETKEAFKNHQQDPSIYHPLLDKDDKII